MTEHHSLKLQPIPLLSIILFTCFLILHLYLLSGINAVLPSKPSNHLHENIFTWSKSIFLASTTRVSCPSKTRHSRCEVSKQEKRLSKILTGIQDLCRADNICNHGLYPYFNLNSTQLKFKSNTVEIRNLNTNDTASISGPMICKFCLGQKWQAT